MQDRRTRCHTADVRLPTSNELGTMGRSSQRAGPEAVLATVAAEHRATLGADLLGLYVHGSWVVGDFEPARSDLDLLAVLEREPDESLIARVGPVLSAIESAHPQWRGRVEVEYVALETVVAFADGRHAEHPVDALEATHSHESARVSRCTSCRRLGTGC